LGRKPVRNLVIDPWVVQAQVSNIEKEVGAHRNCNTAIRRAKKFIAELVNERE